MRWRFRKGWRLRLQHSPEMRRAGEKIPIGYTGETIKLIVEKWIYGPDGGYYYEVVLVGDRVTSISKVRSQ